MFLLFFSIVKQYTKKSYKGLHKNTENHWNFFPSIRGNTVFSRMNIMFFNDIVSVSLSAFFQEKISFAFFDRRVI